MSKTVEANQNTQAINNLSDEDFENLLKDAYQDRKLKNTDNVLLKSIIQECEEKDKEDINDLTFLTEIFQTKKSKHSSKSKNDHSHKKRLEDLLPGKTKNCIINVSSKHSSQLVLPEDCLSDHLSCRSTSSLEGSLAAGAKVKGDSVNSSPYSACDTTLDSGVDCSSSKLDIEMQELKSSSFLEDSWVSKEKSYSLHHRRKSDGDGNHVEVDACVGYPLKKSDMGMTSQQPLHKSASDFSVRDSSDILNKIFAECLQMKQSDREGMDINGNPMKCGRQHSSRQMSEFCESTKFEGKTKQANKKNQKGVVTYQSEEVENFRGNLNLEQLISFINTSGKKGEKLSKTILESKNRHNDSTDLKKFSSKEAKTVQNKNLLKGPKRQASDSEDKAGGEVMSEQEIPNGILKSDLPRTNHQTNDKSASSILPNSSLVSENVSGFAADFYTFSDAATPTYEEEFRVVTKKHRKRRQNKKTDSFRKHNSSSGSNGNILRDLKQDTHRRKSTSSMPPSENSSADNSDLDSVYSLPVSGSVPQTTIRPHTTPSSMSSTPQTSYADITRMSMMNSKEREGYTCNTKARPIGKLASDYANGDNPHKFARREKHAKCAEARLRNTKESVTQTEPPGEIPVNNDIKCEKALKPPRNTSLSIPECGVAPEEEEEEEAKNKALVKKSPAAAATKGSIIPPVTMEEFPTPADNISFGFDFNELELIYLYDRNGAKELPLPLLPKIRDNTTKLLGSDDSSERTNVVSDHTSSSPSQDPLNSGHFYDKEDFEKSASNFNYHQLVNYFKSKWGSFHQDSTAGDQQVYMPVIKYSDC